MKKVLVVLTAVMVLGLGAVAFAGWGGSGYGHMGYGPGYGGHMMGPGYGSMMGYGPGYGGGNDKFLNETADLRREINQKRFDYFEAVRAGDDKKAEAIARELNTLDEKIAEKAPEGLSNRGYGPIRGYGQMMGYGCNW